VNSADILAVVVSYNGCDTIARTVRALRPQVGHLLIVDNGSAPETVAVLEELVRDCGVELQPLGRNLGIGVALNRSAQRARELGYSWLLTMDQDSVVCPDLIEAYIAAIDASPALVCLTPGSRTAAGAAHEPTIVVPYAITSGNLTRLSVVTELGQYHEGLFVDCIDFDFSLRLRGAGYAIHRVPGAAMQHQLGEATRVPAIVRKFYARHPPIRRYYMYRNFLYLSEWHLRRFPVFILKLGLLQVLLLLLIGLYDRNPLTSYRAVFRGVADYLARKDGPCQETL
jgi:rhamnosyltransferase